MIHYHGGPISPQRDAILLLRGHHGIASFAWPNEIGVLVHCCQSFVLDNGAFSFWKSGIKVRWKDYYKWCENYLSYPCCDWAIIPDVIEGGAEANDKLVKEWPFGHRGVPVWHLDEPVDRLVRLVHEGWPRVALGSSGIYDVSNIPACLDRLFEALKPVCNSRGFPIVKLHGLRMLSPKIVTQIPLASADSTAVSRSMGVKWNGPPIMRSSQGLITLQRIEGFNSPATLSAKRKRQEGFGL